MVQACGLSNPGLVRKTNEDSFISDQELRLFVVADGMGGHSAGEVASRLAIEAIDGFMRRSHGDTEFSWPYGVDPNLSYDGNRLKTAIHLANRRVFRAAETHDDYTGMGTTVVGAVITGERLVMGHVGDSRLYSLSQGEFVQITKDDSWLEMVLAREPHADPQALAQHPMRHVLTNVLGAREQAEVHMAERRMQAGETLLLCSDGLYNMVDDTLMHELIVKDADIDAAAKRLVDAALERGGHDNVTAVLVRYTSDK